MFGLAREIRDLWAVCGNVVGRPIPGGQLEIENLDDVIVALDHVLVSVRTLDHEVFEASDVNYRRVRDDTTNPKGQVVRALTGPRNNAVHHADVVDPNVSSAAGPRPDDATRYIITARWKTRAELPPRMFQVPGRGGQLHEVRSVTAAYDATCAGIPLIDTLLDAFAFFDALAPHLARRNDDGSLWGFPLTPYPLVTHYLRLAPDWSTEAGWNTRAHQRARSVPPAGPRTIEGHVRATDTDVLCGRTVHAHGATYFTESVDQVVSDVQMGADYRAELHGALTPLAVLAGALGTSAGSLDVLSLPDLSGDTRWLGWWQLCQTDANYYRRQRSPD